MLESISPHVFCWSEIHGEARNVPYPWNSYLIRVPDSDVVALVDPLPMDEDTTEAVERLGLPTHIILTCEFHLRDSDALRRRWGCEIWVNEVESAKYDTAVDGSFHDGQRLWDFIDLIHVPDVYFDETALLVREGERVLIIGEMLSGGRRDQGIPDGKLGIMGPEYVADLARARRSLHRLLVDCDYSAGLARAGMNG
jgi:hypothetical protein